MKKSWCARLSGEKASPCECSSSSEPQKATTLNLGVGLLCYAEYLLLANYGRLLNVLRIF